jgi:hypothetical protein
MLFFMVIDSINQSVKKLLINKKTVAFKMDTFPVQLHNYAHKINQLYTFVN